MKYQAVIFDFDGTLLDTLDDLADSMNAVLVDFGMPIHPTHPYRFFIGDGMENLARRASPAGTDDATIKKMAIRMGEIYQNGWNKKTKPYDGVMPMLESLRQRGVRMAILSNKPDSFTKIMAQHYFGDSCFEAVFGQRNTVPKKPDPAGAFEIADLFGMPPANFLYFGDTNTDMRTGLAAGMFTVGVTWGFRPVDELIGSGAQAIIDEPAQVVDFLE
ncbi:MAG: HAD family hydrolase [Planctomycetes bacterium]|nr:HAD family hydrolase [Planctomycetota bacterium]